MVSVYDVFKENKSFNKVFSRSLLLMIVFFAFSIGQINAQKKMEYLTRALTAVQLDTSHVFLSWRFLGTDTGTVAFNLYRNNVQINSTPIATSSNFIDSSADITATYVVKAIINGTETALSADSTTVWATNKLEIPVQRPQSGVTPTAETYTYSLNDCSAADLDGDGTYEIIVKWDPSNSKDNSLAGYTGNVYLDAYKLDGTLLWRIDLGKNIRAGAHYTQFIAYDLNSDGKAELACRTADGTIDGQGNVIGDAAMDYRNSNGYILKGPEWLTIFNGETGGAMASAPFWPKRHPVYADTPTTSQMNSIWGDNYGNRIDRFLAGVAYLDGTHPSLIMTRGYYTRAVITAWDWQDSTLTRRWVFDTNFDTLGNANTTYASYRGQGSHSLSIADVDNDGKDEIIYGACAVNDDGTGLYTTGLGHGDALHVSDMNPDRPGLEVFMPHETQALYGNYPHSMNDALTGQILWGGPGPNNGDNGRGMAADIDPRYKGYEAWSQKGGLYTCTGTQISTSRPSINFGIWWDGDLTRELLDGTKISKWNYTSSQNVTLKDFSTLGAASNNTTKANPCLTADLLGDWREEAVWRKSNDSALLLFTTTIPTNHRLYTLMHNAQYREAIAWQNVAYNQPPHPSYYLGDSMAVPPQPLIEVINPFPPTPPGPPDAPTKVSDIGMGNYKALSLYPNPTTYTLAIEFPEADKLVALRLVSMDGKVLFDSKGKIKSLNTQLNQVILKLKAGIYMLTLTDQQTTYLGKFVKK